jgi:hypothetical protein
MFSTEQKHVSGWVHILNANLAVSTAGKFAQDRYPRPAQEATCQLSSSAGSWMICSNASVNAGTEISLSTRPLTP